MITGKYPSLRLRRNRKYDWTRRLVQENTLSSSDFILPIFLIDGRNKKEKIPSMPDVYRYTIDRISQIVDKAIKNKVPMVALFPRTKQTKKNELGTEALNEDNLVCKAILQIKKKYKNEVGIMCDVALDPYTSHGHDGLIKNNEIINDETIEVLVNQSLLQAKMGCDVLAPSDMMDGRIKKIRSALDNEGLKNINILSYAAKYASSYYGPFRDAVGSKGSLKGDKKTYQMDFRNTDEALREISLDIKEGADMVMVKPGMPYLDIIKSIKEKFRIPVFAYQVSGEYSLLSNAINKKIIDKNAIYESLIAFKRAGANAIVTYYADRLDKILI
ncbi:porphobilinogen synthase [Candidatus Pelagibacter sp.]|jgi:porphobilinogen synthase|nr:porphobilinogen synthase [Candidatus Pelagibacter sp.]MDC0632070.1 porphobilinogen synthase [Candidatus Pelagibacter sp.]